MANGMNEDNIAGQPRVETVSAVKSDSTQLAPAFPVAGVGIALIFFAVVSSGTSKASDLNVPIHVTYAIIAIGVLFLLGGTYLLVRESQDAKKKGEDAAIGKA